VRAPDCPAAQTIDLDQVGAILPRLGRLQATKTGARMTPGAAR
jgi:hypothetical protein